MMAVVMGVAPDDEDTLDRAADLGLAFQLANIARDLSEDDAAGRCYIPAEWLAEVDIPPGEQMKPVHRAAMAKLAKRMCSLAQAHDQLRVTATSRVAVRARFVALEPAASPPWAQVAARVRYVAGAPFVAAAEFALPSPYVPRLPALRELGAGVFTPGRPVAEAALELMHRLHAEFQYESRSTDIDTPLAQVLLQKRGVCQDFAHLLAGVLRAWGLPARYVSGYLLTHAPVQDAPNAAGSGAAMLGADASHAWVQLWCPGTPGVPAEQGGADDAWLDLDPTNDCGPGSGHVRVAVGRDFGDVTPLRGVIRGGGGRHTLAVAVRTRRLDAAAEAPPQRARELLTPRPMENTRS
jgi:transglutaminase-like putative cysteine protease